jgi:hypothetical protein
MARMPTMHIGDVAFEIFQDQIEVTMLSRPDEHWRFVDAAGHEHRWYVDGAPVTTYSPTASHELPTLNHVEDYPATEDYPSVSHYECAQCGEHVRPGYTSDHHRQFVAGLKRCYINGEPVSEEEFRRRGEEVYATLKHPAAPDSPATVLADRTGSDRSHA